jgi:glycosyltransferase involved in cell wall biosynthesis
MPLVSVLLPVYNQENFLVETIESVLAQTYTDFEFLIVDDGSTDGSADIILKYERIDNRIKAFYRNNTGKCRATNFLLEKAAGEWTALMDADDVMLQERLERQLKFHLENPGIESSSCHCYFIDEKGRSLGTQKFPGLETKDRSREALEQNDKIMFAFTGMMISTHFFKKIGGLRAEFWPCEDFEVANRIIENHAQVVIIQEVLMKYRIHPYSITATSPSEMWDIEHFVKHCIELRRQGKPEICHSEFKEILKLEPKWVKFKRRWNSYSMMYHRNASFAFHTKNYLLFIWHFTIATVLSPNFVFQTMLNRLKPEKPINSNHSFS